MRTIRALPWAALLAGCASAPRPPGDLAVAESVLARAEASPFAPEASAEIDDAEALLTQAEQEGAADPGSERAAEDAYVARRAAEKAVIASRYAAHRIALAAARVAMDRLEADRTRRDALLASLARRRAAQAEAQAALHQAHRAALERAAGPGAQIVERPSALVLRIPADTLFLRGTSLLRDGAEPLLTALARALEQVPPFELRIEVPDEPLGYKLAPPVVATRRRARVQALLRARGVPEDAILSHVTQPPPGTQIDLVVIEPPLPLPPDG
jgi:hypothetical protein